MRSGWRVTHHNRIGSGTAHGSSQSGPSTGQCSPTMKQRPPCGTGRRALTAEPRGQHQLEILAKVSAGVVIDDGVHAAVRVGQEVAEDSEDFIDSRGIRWPEAKVGGQQMQVQGEPADGKNGTNNEKQPGSVGHLGPPCLNTGCGAVPLQPQSLVLGLPQVSGDEHIKDADR